MNIKKYFAYAMTLLASCFVGACSNDDDPTTSHVGKNEVTLTIQGGNTTLIENEDDAITVSIAMIRAYDTDVQLTVNVQGTETERLTINPQPVTIAAGSKNATFQVTSAKLGNLTDQIQYTLGLTNLQNDMELMNTAYINLCTRTGIEDLTEDQKALVESRKAMLTSLPKPATRLAKTTITARQAGFRLLMPFHKSSLPSNR